MIFQVHVVSYIQYIFMALSKIIFMPVIMLISLLISMVSSSN